MQRAQDAVLNESKTTVESVETVVSQTDNKSSAITHDKTNLDILDAPITESAEEIELNIADSPTITSKSKSNSNKVRTKEDIN